MVNTGSVLRSSITYIRSVLASGVTDPISATRASDSSFVVTNFPEKSVNYPIIVISTELGASSKLGLYSEGLKTSLRLSVDIHSKTVKQRDQLSDDVFHHLRTTQSGTKSNNLYDLRLLATQSQNEMGREGIHRRTLEFSYLFLNV